MDAPYKHRVIKRRFRSTQYEILYQGLVVRKMYGCSLDDVRDIVFLLNTAYAEGGRGTLIGNRIYY